MVKGMPAAVDDHHLAGRRGLHIGHVRLPGIGNTVVIAVKEGPGRAGRSRVGRVAGANKTRCT